MTGAREQGERVGDRPRFGADGCGDGDAAQLALDDALTIAEVSCWHARLLAVARPGSRLAIDAARLEHVDGAGLQLLAATFLDAQRRGYDVSLQACPPALRKAAAQLGLSLLLRLDDHGAD
jgi:anti-anti-sigma regulatory factor